MQRWSLQQVFRCLIATSVFCHVLIFASHLLIWGIVAPQTFVALSGGGVGAVLPLPPAFWWLELVLRVSVAIGMFHFKDRARMVFMSLVGFDLITALLGGVMTRTPFEASLATAESLMNGAILVLAYWSPLRRRFRRKSQRMTPSSSECNAVMETQSTTLDNLSKSAHLRRLRQDYVAAASSLHRHHHGGFRRRLLSVFREAISRMSHFHRLESTSHNAAEHESGKPVS